MAFQQGVSTSPSDLLNDLATFAAANGYTVNTGGLGGDGPGQVSFDDGAGFHVHAIAEDSNDRIRSQPATAYDGSGTAFYAHTGSPNTSGTTATTVQMAEIPGPHTQYYFFAPNSAPRYIHVALEVTAGVYSHWMFGSMTKFGTFTGGGYCTALGWRANNITGTTVPFMSNNPTNVGTQWLRADGMFGGGSPQWHEGIGWGFSEDGIPGLSFVAELYQVGLVNLTQRTPLVPIYMKVSQGFSIDQNIPLGAVQDIRLCALEALNGGDILTIGSDDWRVFPVRVKGNRTGSGAFNIGGDPAPNHDTGLMGLAYREIP